MKFENVKIGQRVQAKVDIYQTSDKGNLLVDKGTLGEVVGVYDSGEHLNIKVKLGDFIDSTRGYVWWWCNHKDIRKVKESKEVKEGVPRNKIAVGDKVKLIKTDTTDDAFSYCGGVMLKVGEEGVVSEILCGKLPAVYIGAYCYAIEDLELVKEGD